MITSAFLLDTHGLAEKRASDERWLRSTHQIAEKIGNDTVAAKQKALSQNKGDMSFLKKKMVHLRGASSNTLFDTLAQWNDVLKSIQNPANAPIRDICGAAG